MRAVEALRFPVEGGYQSDVVGYDLEGDEANFESALAKVRSAMTPPTKDQAEEWLVLLQAATAGARRSEAGSMITLALYSGALARYPADVAKAACETLARTSRWFPVLADIIEHCERLSTPRRLMEARLRMAVANRETAA